MNPLPTVSQINNRILTVRGQKVILDTDLARLYGVPVKRLNEQLSRNLQKFPADFAFQLTVAEWAALRSQLAAVSLQPSGNQEELSNWSQIATSSRLRRGATYRPWAFTEHGALQAANVLNSRQAVRMSLFIIFRYWRLLPNPSAVKSVSTPSARKRVTKAKPSPVANERLYSIRISTPNTSQFVVCSGPPRRNPPARCGDRALPVRSLRLCVKESA
jgi:hypothetical protein